MFKPEDILYEDNHLMVVNKRVGDLVQGDATGDAPLSEQIKQFIKQRDGKPGDVFLGVVHRIDRPVSGAVIFAKTSKALARLNEMVKERQIDKTYWAIVEQTPAEMSGTLRHHLTRNAKTNCSQAWNAPKSDSKEAVLNYSVAAAGKNYSLLEVELITGRHHQIRCQLAAVGSPVKGDLKYGARRSNPGGGISLHARRLSFVHPVRKEPLAITAPVPQDDNLWLFFEQSMPADDNK